MAAFRQDNQKFFPIKCTTDLVNLFRHHLEKVEDDEPDLTLLSIVCGIFENTLTSGRLCDASTTTTTVTTTTSVPSMTTSTAAGNNHHVLATGGGDGSGFGNFPIVEFDVIEKLYKKFHGVLTASDLKVNSGKSAATTYATREIIKKMSDIIWNSLARSSYKDRAHLQSLYSYITGNKLDCFGVAFAVVAGCQMLGYNDAHLAISEDHVWVVFGKNGDETVEVTWHGKGSEDKRGQSVSQGIESNSWLYVSGNPVVCTRHMEVAALVSAINSTLNLTSTCQEVEDFQKQLLWMLYDMGHLKKYPMALGTLGELEEASPSFGRPTCEDLFREAVDSARLYYKNHHVYPYTFQGCYYSRQKKYKNAFSAWANAGDVIRLYNYSRDDEEIYKEFLEIANDTIPQIMKLESSGHSAKSIIRDPQCFANLLRFYDGICQWEEGSLTPILHIGWAKPLVSTISKFDYDIRSQVIINCAEDDEDPAAKSNEAAESIKKSEANTLNNNNTNNNNNIDVITTTTTVTTPTVGSGTTTKVDDSRISSTLKALTAACGEKILNPDFLLQGGGQPFTTETSTGGQGEPSLVGIDEASDSIEKKTNGEDMKLTKNGETEDGSRKEKIEPKSPPTVIDQPPFEEEDTLLTQKQPVITLYSQKMKGLKDLLLAERLNTQAISLQVTAQSQVQVGGKKGRLHVSGGAYISFNEFEGSSRPKRNRRE